MLWNRGGKTFGGKKKHMKSSSPFCSPVCIISNEHILAIMLYLCFPNLFTALQNFRSLVWMVANSLKAARTLGKPDFSEGTLSQSFCSWRTARFYRIFVKPWETKLNAVPVTHCENQYLKNILIYKKINKKPQMNHIYLSKN
jgi:hypothetical protein